MKIENLESLDWLRGCSKIFFLVRNDYWKFMVSDWNTGKTNKQIRKKKHTPQHDSMKERGDLDLDHGG